MRTNTSLVINHRRVLSSNPTSSNRTQNSRTTPHVSPFFFVASIQVTPLPLPPSHFNSALGQFKVLTTQPVTRYLAAASAGLFGAYIGVRSGARTCLGSLVNLEGSKLGGKVMHVSHPRHVSSTFTHTIHSRSEFKGGFTVLSVPVTRLAVVGFTFYVRSDIGCIPVHYVNMVCIRSDKWR